MASLVKAVGNLSVGFQVGPFQASIPLSSASDAIILAVGKFGWWKANEQAKCLEWLIQSQGATLITVPTFDGITYEERRRQYVFHGVTVQGDEESGGPRLAPLTVSNVSTSCSGSSEMRCLRALTSGLLSLFNERNTRTILVDIIPKHLLSFKPGGDATQYRYLQILPAAILNFVTSVEAEEDFDNQRESLLRRLDELILRVTNASVEDLRDCYYFELAQATAMVSWALTPRCEHESEAYQMSHPNVYPFLYPTRSLRVWALAFILQELGFDVGAFDKPVNTAEQYDSILAESQSSLDCKVILVTQPLGRREDTSLNPRGHRAPIAVKRRIIIRNIPSLVFEQYGFFAQQDTDHLSLDELQAIFKGTFYYIQSKLPEYRHVQKFATSPSDPDLSRPQTPEYDDRELSEYQQLKLQDWLPGSQAMKLLAGPILDNIPSECPDTCGKSPCYYPPPQLDTTEMTTAAHAWKEDVRSLHKNETPWIKMHMIMLAFAYAVACQFLRVNGDERASYDTEVILTPIEFYETTPLDRRVWSGSRLLIPDPNTLLWVRTMAEAIGLDQGTSIKPGREVNLSLRFKRVLYQMVCGIKGAPTAPNPIPLGCCANGLTLLSRTIVKMEVSVATLHIHHVEFGRILDLPVGPNKIISACQPNAVPSLINDVQVTRRAFVAFENHGAWTVPSVRWDAEADWERDESVVALRCRVDNVPRFSKNPWLILSAPVSNKLLEIVGPCKCSPETKQAPIELHEDEFWAELNLHDFYRAGGASSNGVVPDQRGPPGKKWYIFARAGVRSQDQLAALGIFNSRIVPPDSKRGASIIRNILSPCFWCAAEIARKDPEQVKNILQTRSKIDQHVVYIVVTS
jgi:hypothetical protein